MPDHVTIRRALLSVSDKTGLLDLARALIARNVELLSTGGTAAALAAAGLEVKLVEEHTGFPEMMDGRLKTLHPTIHGGLLALRDNAAHNAAAEQHNIPPIDLVVVNLYPFRKTVLRPGVTVQEAIENIDIGGPTMIRSAAKNHAFVTVLTSPEHYADFIAEFAATGGISLASRQRLATLAFHHTAVYDATISRWLAPRMLSPSEAAMPAELALPLMRRQLARYGENPHQQAAIYAEPFPASPGVLAATQLHGKELSYNNFNDAAAAAELATALSALNGQPAAAVIKHANPCGASVLVRAGLAREAIQLAIEGDPLAAFGGILAFSGTIDRAAAERLIERDIFLEVLLAADFEPDALAMLKARSENIRLLKLPPAAQQVSLQVLSMAYRSIPGGMLAQERDSRRGVVSEWQHKAGPPPLVSQLQCALATEVCVQAMASNAIAIGGAIGEDGHFRLFGGGLGQVDRVTAARLAVEKCRATKSPLVDAVACSDAFFPFNDGPQILIDAGVRMIVHPGGSKRDGETFELCERSGVTCMITGVRRFRH